MGWQDHLPVKQTPVAARIAFWVVHQVSNFDQQDVTSIILFDSQAMVRNLS